jgi:hypothetical protein
MDLIMNFISSLISAFFIAYIIYIVFNRRTKPPLYFLGFMSLMTALDWFINFRGAPTSLIIIAFLLRVAPYIFAFVIFMFITGLLPRTQKVRKQRPLKSISENINTVYIDRLIVFAASFGALISILFAYFFMDEGLTKYLVMTIGVVGLIMSILFYLKVSKVKKEYVVLLVGKNKEKKYIYEIPEKTTKLIFKSLYNNPMYLVDPIGVAIVYDETKRFEKHYLYWIATSDQIDMSSSNFKPARYLDYDHFLDDYPKYQYLEISFQPLRSGGAEKIAEKRIR